MHMVVKRTEVCRFTDFNMNLYPVFNKVMQMKNERVWKLVYICSGVHEEIRISCRQIFT